MEKKTRSLRVVLEPSLLEKLRIEAVKQGISMSDFARRSIREDLHLFEIENSQLTKLENSGLARVERLLEKALKKMEAGFGKRSAKTRSF
jgi:hypothetical protein